VVKVRRNSDDAEADFTAVEVSDGTLLNWVNADVVTYTSDFSAGTDGWIGFNTTPASQPDPVDAGNVLKVTVDTALSQHFVNGGPLNQGNTCSISAQVYVPSSNAILDGIAILDASGGMNTNYDNIATDQWVNIPTSGTVIGTTLSIRGKSGTDLDFQGNGTDVFYVRNVVITQTTADGHVSTWYDQSGNTKHATQATAASQPKVVDAGVLVSGGIDFDGTDDWLQSSNSGAFQSSDGVGFFSVYKKKTVSTSDVFTGVNPQYLMQVRDTSLSDTTFAARILGGKLNVIRANEAGSDFFTTTASTHTIGNNTTLSSVVGLQSVNLFNDGTELSLSTDESGVTYDIADSSILLGTQDGGTRFLEGFISEIIIYNSDQSDNRTALEANIGEVYGIAGIPAYDNTVNGFVETWYDQSGNGNNASQSTASNQPKIVDAGVLVLSNGDAAIKSTASTGLNFIMASLSADGQQSVFGVLENDVTSQDNFSSVVLALSSSTSTNGVNRRPYWFIAPDGRLVFSVDSDSGYTTANRERRLYSHIMEDTAGGTSTIYQDGTQVDTRSITLDANPNFILAQVGVVGTNAVGALYTSEVIYYPSDESAKRAAIEDNIDNHYGITSAGSYVNAAGDSYINAAGDTYLQP
jgi:hypothetical protein